jgi:anti-sigma factor RsiW
MSCSNIDVKGYLLGELPEQESEQVAAHLAACEACREEWDRLQVTQAALMSVREEEVPRRIAFVSDKVFEPNWWQRLWRSGPRLGFASAMALSCAILVHAVTRPAPVAPPALDTAAVQQIVEHEVALRLDTAVAQAVAAAETRQQGETAKLLAAAEQRYEMDRRADRVALQETFEYLQKSLNTNFLASAQYGDR